ncbi:hypothetical protein [Neobacillus kokaensis]|uniref:hypothetical protein n=1 Tax=Neobacillus kokaensis TaxID=2759023 RepID=UPI00174DCA78|nr:hypothetical protein [Neobacillus kokaensis]
MPKKEKNLFSGQWEGVPLPEKEEKSVLRSMGRGSIDRKGPKIRSTVNGKGFHCPKRKKNLFIGQWEEVPLPEKEKKSVLRSMGRGSIARKGEKISSTVNEGVFRRFQFK